VQMRFLTVSLKIFIIFHFCLRNLTETATEIE
jgi:hypothetical protein